MENKKQQTKAPLAPSKPQQQPSKNAQMPSSNKSPAQQKKPGSNW